MDDDQTASGRMMTRQAARSAVVAPAPVVSRALIRDLALAALAGLTVGALLATVAMGA